MLEASMDTLSRKKLFLIFHGRFPGEKAAALFAAKSAEAFADAGLGVTVLAPRRLARVRETPHDYFGTKDNFRTVLLPVIDLFGIPFLKRFAFYVSYISSSIFLFFYLLFAARRSDIVYSNESLPLLLASFFFPLTFYEVHDLPVRSFLNRTLLSRVRGSVATNRWKKDELSRRFDLSRERILYEPNAVDAPRFGKAQGNAAREKLPISAGTVLVGYAGTLKTMGMEKGIQTLLDAIHILPPRYRLLIVGGLAPDIAEYREKASRLGISDRVTFLGWMRHDSVPEHLAACDVLAAPFPKTPHYDLYMSPMKLFEYMAVGKPIVATRLHTIEEIVSDDCAFLVAPNDPKALADGIIAASSDPSASARAARAKKLVQEHTWEKRAARIVDFLR